VILNIPANTTLTFNVGSNIERLWSTGTIAIVSLP
jgi:hypothetical protein